MRVLNDLCLVFYNISRRLFKGLEDMEGGGLNNKTIHPHYTHRYSGLKIPIIRINIQFLSNCTYTLYLHIIRTVIILRIIKHNNYLEKYFSVKYDDLRLKNLKFLF